MPSAPYSPPSLESTLHNSTESVELLLINKYQQHNGYPVSWSYIREVELDSFAANDPVASAFLKSAASRSVGEPGLALRCGDDIFTSNIQDGV
jgi:hypothetical protein